MFKINYKIRKGDTYDNLVQRFGPTVLSNAGIYDDSDIKIGLQFEFKTSTRELAELLQKRDLEWLKELYDNVINLNAKTFDTFWAENGNDFMARYGRELNLEEREKLKNRLRLEYIYGSNSIKKLLDKAEKFVSDFWLGKHAEIDSGFNNLEPKYYKQVQEEFGRPLTDLERTFLTNHTSDYENFVKMGKGKTYLDYLNYLDSEHKDALSTRDYATKAGYGIMGLSAAPLFVNPTTLSYTARKIVPGIIAKKISLKGLDYTNLDEETKNIISSGIGFGVGFGSGNLLSRALKGAGDFLAYQKIYRPIATNIVGDNIAADVLAGGVQGIGLAAMNSLSHEGLTFANNLLQKSSVSQPIKYKGYKLLGNLSDKVGNLRILAEIPTKMSEIPILLLSGVTSGVEHGVKGIAHSILPALSMNGLNGIVLNTLLSNMIDPDLLENMQTAIMVYGPRAIRTGLNRTNYGNNAGRRYIHLGTEGSSGLILPIKNLFTGKYKNYDGTYNVSKMHIAAGGGNYASRNSNGLGLLDLIYLGKSPERSINGVYQHGTLREGWVVPKSAGIEYDAYLLNLKLWGGRTPERRLRGQKWALISPMEKLSYLLGLREALNESFKGVNSGDAIIGRTNGINPYGLPLYNYYNGRGHLGSTSFYADKGGSGSGARFEPKEGLSRLITIGKGILQSVALGVGARPLDYGAELLPLFFSRVHSLNGTAKPTNNGMNVGTIGMEDNFMPVYNLHAVESMKKLYYTKLAKEKSLLSIDQYNQYLTELLLLLRVKGTEARKRRKALKKKIKDHETIINLESYVNGLKIGGKLIPAIYGL